jgi:hypothetical protein
MLTNIFNFYKPSHFFLNDDLIQTYNDILLGTELVTQVDIFLSSKNFELVVVSKCFAS